MYEKLFYTNTPTTSNVNISIASVSTSNKDTPIFIKAFTVGIWGTKFFQNVPYKEDANPDSYAYLGSAIESSHMVFNSSSDILCSVDLPEQVFRYSL